MGTVCLPEMTRYNYKKTLSTGMISAGGTMGILIPPSTGFIVYGTISEASIGDLFAAGIVPGILLMVLFWITIGIVTWRDPKAGPAGDRFPLIERLKALKGVIGFAILFVIVLGGIFGGVISPSEGGGVGAIGAFVIMVIRRRATLKNIITALRDTIMTSAMIFMIMIGAYIFGYFLTQTRMPRILAEWTSSLDVSPFVVLIMVLIVYIILGCFVDSLPLVIILTPIFMPIVMNMEWSLLWFGVLMILCMQIGLITPPVGMCCYVMAGVAKDVPLKDIFKGAFPFLIALIVMLALVMVFPDLATWLPSRL
jgi:tripartite ATP-independent transporter DctM subunit